MDWRWLLTSFEGRINRAKFWVGVIALWILYIILNIVVATLFGIDYSAGNVWPVAAPGAWLLYFLLAVVITLATLAVLAKRWHDRDKSGWWSLISLVPFIGGIWILVECGCMPGTEGPNRFGSDPLAGT
ncbi:MAG TPA: DUF805 domain-containing protein [Aestuariivirgaceae bacterium]|jgi:uncharacterized membrane protein YhaH (DUF805 family)